MTDNSPLELPQKHLVTLTDMVISKLKERAVIEGQSASEIIVYNLKEYLKTEDPSFSLPRYQERLSKESLDKRQPRTIYVPDSAWKSIQKICKKGGYSISGLIEYLIRKYLFLDIEEEALDKADSSSEQNKKSGSVYDPGQDGFTLSIGKK